MIHIFKAGGERKTADDKAYSIDMVGSRQDCPNGWYLSIEEALKKAPKAKAKKEAE